jgi:hypothetical protein
MNGSIWFQPVLNENDSDVTENISPSLNAWRGSLGPLFLIAVLDNAPRTGGKAALRRAQDRSQMAQLRR